MGDKRAGLNFSMDDDQANIEDFAGGVLKRKPIVDIEKVKEAAEQSGFISRQPKRRRLIKRSPYTIQYNLKTRLGMKELVQELGDRLDIYDQETFERAILALIEKEGYSDLKEAYDKIMTHLIKY